MKEPVRSFFSYLLRFLDCRPDTSASYVAVTVSAEADGEKESASNIGLNSKFKLFLLVPRYSPHLALPVPDTCTDDRTWCGSVIASRNVPQLVLAQNKGGRHITCLRTFTPGVGGSRLQALAG
jgi:hypothetical protein